MTSVRFAGCAGCGACLLTCPTHAIRPHGGELYALDERCTGCGECVEVCPVDAVWIERSPTVSREVPPIEAKSYRILRARADTGKLPPRTRDVVERVVHATADLGYVDDLVCDEDALAAGTEALAGGAPMVVDAQMVAAGITSRDSLCMINVPKVVEIAERDGVTRSAAGFRLAVEIARQGAVWVVGVAPTALSELIDLAAAGRVRPALVVGVPVGFVGAAESKAALRDSGLPAVSNRSGKGGAGVAAAVVNALLYGDPLEGDTT